MRRPAIGPAAPAICRYRTGTYAERMSGCRRITPSAEQGASSKMRSNGLPSHQLPVAPASPSRDRLAGLRRLEFSRTRRSRCGSMSTADSSPEAGSRSAIKRGFAARRGAGVENPLTGGQRERKCNALRAQVLHRHYALARTRAGMHIAGRIQDAWHCARAPPRARRSRRLEFSRYPAAVACRGLTRSHIGAWRRSRPATVSSGPASRRGIDQPTISVRHDAWPACARSRCPMPCARASSGAAPH